MSTPNVLEPGGKPRLVSEKCSTCIFRPGNPMDLRPGRVRGMVRDSLAGGGFITCHSTLPTSGTQARPAICRGFFDAYGHLSNVLRIWGRLGGFTEVEPSCLRPAEADEQAPR